MTGDSSEIVRRFERAQDRLVLQASDLSLETIGSMVDGGAIDIQPQYQRRARWSNEKRSALIESFLLNIPVPPIYLAEDDYGVYSVIDGKQRITAIRDFMRDDFALTKLEDFVDLAGRRFSQLPRELSNALRVRPYIRAITLLRQSDPDLKYEVFQRLNTGGEPLNAQEIRNVAFRGPLNDLIYELAGAEFLRQQLKIRNDRASNYRNMLDAEFVLRFLTLVESWKSFSGDFRRSMDDYMADNRAPSGAALRLLGERFTDALSWCERLWGDHAFQRPVDGGWRDQALAGMYDAQMVAVASVSDAKLNTLNPGSVQSATRRLFEDGQFEVAVREGTNTPQRIRYRISELTNRLTDLAERS
jgi:hypothetical protein